MTDKDLRIIYLRDETVLVSKRAYRDWREIQDLYDQYMASLGPWPVDEVVDFLNDEYPELSPAAAVQIAAFIEADIEETNLTFDMS